MLVHLFASHARMTDIKHDLHDTLIGSRVILGLRVYRIFSEPQRQTVEMYASAVIALVDRQNNVSYTDWGGGVFAGCLPRVQLFVSTCNRRPHLALHHDWLLPVNCHFDDCKARLVRFRRKTRYIRIPGFSFKSYISYVNRHAVLTLGLAQVLFSYSKDVPKT